MLQRDLQHNKLHSNHDASLNKQCRVKTSSKPVEDFEEGCNEHNEWDVEGEAGGRLGAVNAIDLVGVGRQRRDDETRNEKIRSKLQDYQQPERKRKTTYNTGATYPMTKERRPMSMTTAATQRTLVQEPGT